VKPKQVRSELTDWMIICENRASFSHACWSDNLSRDTQSYRLSLSLSHVYRDISGQSVSCIGKVAGIAWS